MSETFSAHQSRLKMNALRATFTAIPQNVTMQSDREEDSLPFLTCFLVRASGADQNCRMVFMSMGNEFSVMSYRLEAVHCLQKPVEPEQVEEALKRLIIVQA